MRWKIFYADGSSFSDADGLAYQAPAFGVQVITQSDGRVGRAFIRESDYYIFSKTWYGGWQGVDLAGLLDYIMHSNEPAVIKIGRTVDNETWNRTLIAAADDTYCPPKSASRRLEPKPRPLHG